MQVDRVAVPAGTTTVLPIVMDSLGTGILSTVLSLWLRRFKMFVAKEFAGFDFR